MKESNYILDLRGEICPMPVLKTRNKLSEMNQGETVEVIVDYPAAQENIKRTVEQLGSEVMEIVKEENDIHIVIKK
jgi:tRNA 2-thiouridine synthesizing protein A